MKDLNNNPSVRQAFSGQISARQPVSRRLLAFFVFAILLFQQFAFFVPVSAKSFPLPARSATVAVSDDIVISQAYGGGGNAGAVYRNDFIEVFNRGSVAVSVAGWSVQYASATGSSWQKTDLTGSIPPGGYYLIQEAAGAAGTTDLPTPNATGTINMSGTAGKVALVTNTTLLTCGGATNNCFPNAAIRDFLGYGATANNFEGAAPTANLSNTTAAIRNGNGCTDTDSNSTDFTLAAPTPRNSSSPAAPCSTSTNPSGTGAANPASVVPGASTLLTVTVTPGANPTSTGITVSGDLSSIGGSTTQAFFDNGTNGDTTAGDNIFSYNATVDAGTAVGNKTLPVTIGDAQGRSGSTSIALNVIPASAPPTATGAANPSSLPAGGTTLLTVTVTPGTNPTSTGITVTADLSAIGGAATQNFFDDGTNGDVTPADNIFSFNATVAAGTSPGAKMLPATATDAQMRTANATISLTVTPPASSGQPIPFSQNWSNTGLITTNNDWSGVPGIVGYRGDDLTTATGTDPQTIVADGATTPVNVTANQTAPDTFISGGIAEFELTNPVVAFQGSGTSDAPHLVISIDTTGQNNITVSYNLRDIDGSTDNAVQPVALQYRVGATGNYTNLPAAFVADASSGPSEATLVTPVNVALPAAVNNQPLVQLRIITTNAVGNDELIGVDDINILSGGTIPLSASGSASPNLVDAGTATLLSVTVNPATNPASTGITVNGDLTSIGGVAMQQFFDDGTNGDVTAGDNTFSYLATIPANASSGGRMLPISVADAQMRTATTMISLTVRAAVNPQVHLTMGNPTNAVTDVNMPTNYLLLKNQYVMSYHRDRAIPNWVSWHLDASWLGSAPRQDDFRPDPSLPAGWFQVQANSYSGSGFDRGHHTPSADRTATIPDNSATFFMTNMMPQAPDNNQGPWEQLESFGRTLVNQGNELYILAAGTGNGGVGSNGAASTIAGGNVAVPSYTWKVILVLPSGDNDVTRVTDQTRTIAVIMPNRQGIRNDPWQKYLATVDQVEALTGYNFYSNVPEAIQSVIESRLDPASNTSPQTVAGGTYDTLTIDGPNTTLTGNVTVTGTLNLGGSTLNTGSFKLTLAPGATVSRISGYVIGQVEKQFSAPSANAFEFPVGTENGYSPVRATVTAVGVNPSSLTVKAVQAVHPNAPNPATALKRYWTLTETGDLTANLTFKYLDADVPAAVTESALRLYRYASGFTQIPAALDPAGNTATASGISEFSDWTLLVPANALPSKARADFDGDGKTDLSVFRPSEGNWYLNRSTAGFTAVQFGTNSDILTPGDFDGDGKTDVAVFRPSTGTWYRINSGNGQFVAAQFGQSGDIPVSADFDGDGKTDLAVFRPSEGNWYFINSSSGTFVPASFGQNGDLPVPGDFDGDGKANLAVFRPSTGFWYIARATGVPSQNFDAVQFGTNGDIPAAADYDGDNRQDVTVFRPSDGTWYRLNSSNGQFVAVQFGANGDLPAPGDYDGDGRDDQAVYRGGVWYINRSTSGFAAANFGLGSDRPVPNEYLP